MAREVPLDLWDGKRVAEFLGLDYGTIRHGGAGTNKIPRIRMGRSVRFDPEDVIAFREERRQWALKRINRRLSCAS